MDRLEEVKWDSLLGNIVDLACLIKPCQDYVTCRLHTVTILPYSQNFPCPELQVKTGA